MRNLKVLGLVLGVALLGLARVAGAVGGDPYLMRSLIDVDSDAETGCDVVAHDDNFAGPVTGIEYIVTARVFRFPANGNVAEVTLQTCVSGTTFTSPTQVDPGDWPVGINVGVNGADVVEFYVQRLALGDPKSMTVSFHATIPAVANDVLLTTNGLTVGDPIFFSLDGKSVPALSWVGLGLCASILLLATAWLLRRNRKSAFALVALGAVVASVMTARAVTIMLDGAVGDWSGVPAAGTDVLNDSTVNDPGEDIVAAFITADAQNVYFRMDQLNLAPCGANNQPCCRNPGGPFCTPPNTCEGSGNAGGGTCEDDD